MNKIDFIEYSASRCGIDFLWLELLLICLVIVYLNYSMLVDQ